MNKKLIRLTESDLHRIIKESIYRIITEIDTNGHPIVLFHNIRFEEFNDGNTIDISVYNGRNQMGYLKIEIHDYDSLESEIFGTTDSYDIVDDVFSMLNKRRPIIELSDTTVNKEYRRMGVSKMLLEYVLNKYSDYQFFLRVCPYGGGGPNDITLANSLKKYGFENVEVDDSDYGIFLVKR